MYGEDRRGETKLVQNWKIYRKDVEVNENNEIKEINEFFFFRQETAYTISACLVGSGMCIGDRSSTHHLCASRLPQKQHCLWLASYTHLTLPTIYFAQISVVAAALHKTKITIDLITVLTELFLHLIFLLLFLIYSAHPLLI